MRRFWGAFGIASIVLRGVHLLWAPLRAAVSFLLFPWVPGSPCWRTGPSILVPGASYPPSRVVHVLEVMLSRLVDMLYKSSFVLWFYTKAAALFLL